MTSDLFKTGRLINNEDFVTRVSAAMILHAQSLVTSPASSAKNLAIYTLIHPMRMESSMTALVASDPTVLAAVTMTDNVLVDMEALPDSAVKSVVAAKWAVVAAKYPQDPTPTTNAL